MYKAYKLLPEQLTSGCVFRETVIVKRIKVFDIIIKILSLQCFYRLKLENVYI